MPFNFLFSVNNQNNQQVPVPANSNGGSVAAMVRDIVWINVYVFKGRMLVWTPQNFINEVKKIFGVIQVTRNDRVELVTYQLKNVAHIWFTKWEENTGENATFMSL